MNHSNIFIASSMRAGSTLLKALLATKSDVSDLPEIHFSNIISVKTTHPIMVFKCPAYYDEFSSYPNINDKEGKIIALIRNPLDTVSSLLTMNKRLGIKEEAPDRESRILLSYWVYLYEDMLVKLNNMDNATLIVRYENLIANPHLVTAEIFNFIGCGDKSGVDEYFNPSGYKWKWGTDDGGDLIKTLSIKKSNMHEISDVLSCSAKIYSDNVCQIMTNYSYSSIQIDEFFLSRL